MFRDTEDALRQLQEQLLEEEEAEAGEKTPEETSPDDLLQEENDSESAENYTDAFHDYSRHSIYNTDRCDTDLDVYSEAVRTPKRGGCLIRFFALLAILMTAVVVALVWLYLHRGGLL